MFIFIYNKKWLFVLLLLSACVSLPKEEQTENLLSIPSVDTSIKKSLSSSFFSLGDWPESNWWEVFQSEQLNKLIEEALVQNPSIQGIKKRITLAEQSATIARSRLFPLIFFNADETWQYLSRNGLYRAFNPHLPLNANLVDLTLSFNYEFDFWGKNNHLFHSALGQSKAEEAETAQVQLITTIAVAQAYFALKTNLLRRELYATLVEVRENIFSLQDLLQEKALFSRLPPLLAEENLLEAQKLWLGIEEEIATNKHLINILMGRGPDFPLEIDGILPPLPKSISIPDHLSLDLLARRPDLMAQIWRVEALGHEVGAAKADFYPNVNLTAFAGLESIMYSLLFKADSKTAALQPAIHLPIFTAGAIRANVRAKKASFDQAVYDYNQLLLRGVQEVADLLVFAESVYKQKEDQEQILKNAITRYELTDLRVQSGLDNLLDHYAIQEELIQKQLDNVNLLYGQYLAIVKLIKALGGGYESAYSIPLKGEVKSDER